MNKEQAINPKHYEMKVNGQPIQVADLMEARFHDDAHLSQALKYLMRAGRKSQSSYLNDVGKCVWWCVRAMMFHQARTLELPPGAERLLNVKSQPMKVTRKKS